MLLLLNMKPKSRINTVPLFSIIRIKVHCTQTSLFRVISDSASVLCSRNYRLRYRVSTLKVNCFSKIRIKVRQLFAHSENAVLIFSKIIGKICFVCQHISNYEKRTFSPLTGLIAFPSCFRDPANVE